MNTDTDTDIDKPPNFKRTRQISKGPARTTATIHQSPNWYTCRAAVQYLYFTPPGIQHAATSSLASWRRYELQ